LLEALRTRADSDHVRYAPGASFDKEIDIAAAAEAARGVDVAIVALAEKPSAEKPGDISDLYLPDAQLELARAIEATGTPTVIVLLENRPRIVRQVVDSARAVLLAYQPGPFGGEAIADVLFGAVNPSGRLPFTYPRYPNALLHYDHTAAEEVSADFGNTGYNPQWDFGYGLSYTTFEYSNLRVAQSSLGTRDTLVVSVDVTNSGKRDGLDVVQLYVRDLYASIVPPVRRLRAFQKIAVAAGRTRTVLLRVPVTDLAFIGRDNKPVVEPGEFDVMVGGLKTRIRVR
jgi:beta-glucosidase